MIDYSASPWHIGHLSAIADTDFDSRLPRYWRCRSQELAISGEGIFLSWHFASQFEYINFLMLPPWGLIFIEMIYFEIIEDERYLPTKKLLRSNYFDIEWET